MATPTLNLLNYALINTADANTNWTDATTPDPDVKVEGTNSMSGILRADGEASYYTNGTAISAVGKTFRMWFNSTAIAYMKTEAAGGYEVLMYDGTTTETKTIFGQDTYNGGWFNVVIDAALFTTLTLANVTRWGIQAGHTINARNVLNNWNDYLKYLDGYAITSGTEGDPVTLTTIAERDRINGTTLVGYGIILENEGVFISYGKLIFGTGATSTYFLMDGQVLVYSDKPVADGLYEFSIDGSGCEIFVNNSVIKGASPTGNTRVYFDFSDPNTTVTFINNVISNAGTTIFSSGQTLYGNSYTDSGIIYQSGATLYNFTLNQPTGTMGIKLTDVSKLYNTDFYSSGTGYAIEGFESAGDYDLVGITFTNYAAGVSGTTGNEAVHVLATTGTVNLNISGAGTAAFSYHSEGAAVNIIAGSVTVSATVKNTGGDLITGARVYIYAASGGTLPHFSAVTIVNSGTLATVTHTSHGLVTNDKVNITGSDIQLNNGVHQITKINDNSYSYVMGSAPGSSPTANTYSTFVALEGLTVAGVISTSRVYISSQPVSGWVRRGSSEPLYKTSVISDTISSTNGLPVSIVLVSDE